MSTTLPLEDEIKAFLAETGMSPSRLGREAFGDPGFVSDLSKGRRLWPNTVDKVRAFMSAYREQTSTRPDPTPPTSTVSAV